MRDNQPVTNREVDVLAAAASLATEAGGLTQAVSLFQFGRVTSARLLNPHRPAGSYPVRGTTPKRRSMRSGDSAPGLDGAAAGRPVTPSRKAPPAARLAA